MGCPPRPAHNVTVAQGFIDTCRLADGTGFVTGAATDGRRRQCQERIVMWLLDQIAEARIAEAMERGEFDNLPGAGKPLELDDDSMVPEGLRVAYRILKNAGYVPEEVLIRNEIRQVEDLLWRTHDGDERQQARKRLEVLMLRLSLARGGRRNLQIEAAYFEKLLDHFSVP